MEELTRTNILLLYSAKGFGGLPRNLSLIVAGLSPKRFAVHVAMLTDPTDEQADLRTYAKASEISHVQFHQVGSGGTFEFGGLFQVRKLIDEFEIDVVSCHGYKADVFGAVLRSLCKRRFGLVSIAHGWGVQGRKLRFYYSLDKFALRRFNKVVLLTEAQAAELGWKQIPPDIGCVIPNGIDLQQYARLPDRNSARKELLLPPDVPLLGYVGRLGTEKNIEDTVRALRLVVDKVPQTRLVLAGEGPAMASITARANTLGIYDRIFSIGYVQDPRIVYAAIDIYVSNSVHEGIPNSVLEALASGVPCILTNIAGHRNLIEDGKSGFLIRTSDHQLCAQKIIELLKNDELRAQFSELGKVTIQQTYSLKRRIERLEEVYLAAAQAVR